jgi:hypothetical protein
MIQLGFLFLSLEVLLLSSLTLYIGVVNNPKLAIDLSYDAIYYYSKFQLLYKKMKKNIMKQIRNNPHLNQVLNNFTKKSNENDIEFIKDGNIILSINKNKLLNDPTIIPDGYDFIIYTNNVTLDDENSILHKKIFKQIPKMLEEFDCEKVDYKFIMMEVIMNDKNLAIELSNNERTYMVLNNEIDEKFMKYYIKKYLSHDLIDYDNETNNYKLKYIDQNVNMGELNNTHIMIIKNNEITIVDNFDNKNE